LKISKDLTFEKLVNDDILKRSVVRCLEIIGEAIKLIPSEIKDKYKQIEWRKIAGMRDKLIYHYFGVDYALVLDILKKNIPQLEKDISNLLIDEI
jgi:uncharacterized protein with HEPN domain